jgi:hypothetical protein
VQGPPQRSCRPRLLRCVSPRQSLLRQPIGVGMPPLPEERLHLVFGDGLTGAHAAEPGQAVACPPPRGLPALGVVVTQARVTSLRRVERCHLPRQVRVAVPGSQLVQRHHGRGP